MRKFIKLNIQLFGGRGASSSQVNKSINGRPIVKSANGYNLWAIGKNAPKGYVGLIKPSGSINETAYIKSKYADEYANAGYGANYDNLEKELKRNENKLTKLKNGSLKLKGDQEIAIRRTEKLINDIKVGIKVKKELGIK